MIRIKLDFKPIAQSADNNGGDIIMAVQLICPNLSCRKFLAVPDDVRGKLVKCQHCQTNFRVPEVRRPAPAATASATR
jgi:hypothetical protein